MALLVQGNNNINVRTVPELECHTFAEENGIEAAGILPNGRLLVVGDRKRKDIPLLDTRTGAELSRLPGKLRDDYDNIIVSRDGGGLIARGSPKIFLGVLYRERVDAQRDMIAGDHSSITSNATVILPHK